MVIVIVSTDLECVINGEGVQADKAKALVYISKAVELGNENAELTLAELIAQTTKED